MAGANKSGGLAGVTAGSTSLCTVGKEGAGLTYRGYDIYDLADHACFEEVAYLLLHGKLPTKKELDGYVSTIKANRGLPDALKTVLEMVPANTHPMDVLRTGVSFLGNIEPEGDFASQNKVADRLLSCLPSMLLYWHRFHVDGVRIDTETDDDSISGHFLHLLHDKPPKELHRKCLDTTLILYAEHEFNASTFAGRVITGTLSDMHSAVTGAIGALRGPLHGGANEAAMALISKFKTPEEATAGVLGMLQRKELIMGFGHRVYTTSDPRNAVNKRMSKALAADVGNTTLYPISEAVEKVMWDEKKLFANADFFAASVYHFMGIPTCLFTPIFVCSRITGWAAHIMEQRSNNKLIRPAAEYIGPGLQNWVAIADRK
ncbi:MAG: 2-methylcitrate synthase [Gammaproteobacteria bacterium]|nr:2-methylcitrate synthase [Gammaproteobacteria bacterium]MDH5239795.1 2-methylcitrate synthase [Gammaproteobacteria bacterium]MDH5260980.1 2-methylcitrate synthase [Gammaproteobacteria bacterium]MDH5583166.1 2-methylcitrate synthase [Gammaproteobacteria bacterium]